jgi:hypothetical protein
MMAKGVTSEDLLNRHAIERYVKDNAKLWYNYVINKCGRAIDNGDIRIVVGCDKVSSLNCNFCKQRRTTSASRMPLSHESTRSYSCDCVDTTFSAPPIFSPLNLQSALQIMEVPLKTEESLRKTPAKRRGPGSY